jgi:hypothetical protein
MAAFCRRHDLKRPTLAAWVKRELLAASSLPTTEATPLITSSSAAAARTCSAQASKAKFTAHHIATPVVASEPLPALTVVTAELPLNSHAAPVPMCLLLPGGARLTLPAMTSADWLGALLRGLS